jgi:hypothetical protein
MAVRIDQHARSIHAAQCGTRHGSPITRRTYPQIGLGAFLLAAPCLGFDLSWLLLAAGAVTLLLGAGGG